MTTVSSNWNHPKLGCGDDEDCLDDVDDEDGGSGNGISSSTSKTSKKNISIKF